MLFEIFFVFFYNAEPAILVFKDKVIAFKFEIRILTKKICQQIVLPTDSVVFCYLYFFS